MLRDVYLGVLDTPELYEPQRDMLDAIKKAREEGVNECYVDVATGVGKTYAVAHDIKRYLEEKPNARVLYLCHKGPVLEQARDTVSELVHPETSHGNFYGGQSEDREQIVYATFQSMGGGNGDYKNYEAFDPSEFDYIVVDESHHGPAPTYAEVIQYFKPDFQIGLTATEERMDGKDIGDILGPKIFQYTLEEAIAEAVLAKPDYRLYTEHEENLKELLEDIDVPPTLKELNERLTRVKNSEDYKRNIVKEIRKAQSENEDPRTVIYCPDIKQAEEYSRLITEGQTLHSGLSSTEQDRRLKEFREGKIPTLLVVDIFNEGIDVPEINTLVFLRGTESKAVFLQQLGRGLRKIEGKDKVIALDFASSWQRIMMIAELKEDVERIRAERAQEYGLDGGTYPKYTEDPFKFDFSKEALDAIEIVQSVRDSELKAKRAKNGDETIGKYRNAREELCEMLGLDTRDLPNQRISAQEARSYARKIVSGDEAAKQEYIMRRLQSVMMKAQTAYSKQTGANYQGVDDLFQNGLVELKKIINEYTPEIHERYPDINKHVSYKVSKAIFRESVNTASLIPVSANKIKVTKEFLEDIAVAEEKYFKEHLTTPDDKTLAELLGISIRMIQEIRDMEFILHEGYVQYSDLAGTQDVLEEPVSNVVHSIMCAETLRKSVDSLSERDRRVLELREGLIDGRYNTLDKVATAVGLTRERVRQIQHSSLKQLHRYSGAIALRGSLTIEMSDQYHLAQVFPRIQPYRNSAEEEIIRRLYINYNYLKVGGQSRYVTYGEIFSLERQWRKLQSIEKSKNKIWLEGLRQSRYEGVLDARIKRRKEIWKTYKLEDVSEKIQRDVYKRITKMENMVDEIIARKRRLKIIEKAIEKLEKSLVIRETNREEAENKIESAKSEAEVLAEKIVRGQQRLSKLKDDIRGLQRDLKNT